MCTYALSELFKRDLQVLKSEIEAYSLEGKLWSVDKGISNSAGNLCLHIIGNLNHFIGAILGDSGYIRKRDLEFSLKDVPRAKLLEQIDATVYVVERTLKQLTASDLEKEYKKSVFAQAMTTEYFLIHLAMHLAYHLGQINYHRRILDDVRTD